MSIFAQVYLLIGALAAYFTVRNYPPEEDTSTFLCVGLVLVARPLLVVVSIAREWPTRSRG